MSHVANMNDSCHTYETGCRGKCQFNSFSSFCPQVTCVYVSVSLSRSLLCAFLSLVLALALAPTPTLALTFPLSLALALAPSFAHCRSSLRFCIVRVCVRVCAFSSSRVFTIVNFSDGSLHSYLFQMLTSEAKRFQDPYPCAHTPAIVSICTRACLRLQQCLDLLSPRPDCSVRLSSLQTTRRNAGKNNNHS